jgi:peptidylprolyl isomerase domain and WD repeat-containing protein 1
MAENDETILGKREREGADRDEPMKSAGGDDSSDDEVGPMPLPAGAQGAPKKKRKGMLSQAFNGMQG